MAYGFKSGGRKKGSKNKKKTWGQILDRTNRKLVKSGVIDMQLLDDIIADPDVSARTKLTAWQMKVDFLRYSIAHKKPAEEETDKTAHVQLGFDFGNIENF